MNKDLSSKLNQIRRSNRLLLSVICLGLLFTVLACAGAGKSESPEVTARKQFAREINRNYPFQVNFSAIDQNSDELSISVIEDVSRYGSSGAVEMIATEKLEKMLRL